MDADLGINSREVSLRARVKLYKKRAREIESYLSKRPNEWGKFQSEFNSEVNAVFRNIMNFEKENMLSGRENQIYKLKRLFVRRFRRVFTRGVYCEWSIRKPFGYAGDFKIIDDIYQNNPATTGFDRLFDNYFQMSAISVAVRNRKEDFKRLIMNFIANRKKRKLKIMSLASGSCRELQEIFSLNGLLSKNATFDCYDNDDRAIEFAKSLLGNSPRVNFFKKNAVRLSLTKDVYSVIDNKYDFIYSAGLFDYFSDRIAVRLVKTLKKLLNPEGILAISNVRDRYSNPSVHFMEWAGDWNLVYREDEEFEKIFIEAGFTKDEIEIQYEQQGIMAYIVVSNKKG